MHFERMLILFYTYRYIEIYKFIYADQDTCRCNYVQKFPAHISFMLETRVVCVRSSTQKLTLTHAELLHFNIFSILNKNTLHYATKRENFKIIQYGNL